jgi:hypothetical protein
VAPQTDPDEVILLDDGVKLVPAAQVDQVIWGGGHALVIGLLLVLGACYLSHRLGPASRLRPVPAGSLCRAN